MLLEEVIWPNKYLLLTFGLWPMRSDAERIRRIFAYLQFIVALLALMGFFVPEVMTVVSHWGDIGILGDLGSLIIIHSQLTMKIFYFMLRRRSFRSMYQHIQHFWDINDDPEERKYYERPANAAKLTTIVFGLAAFSNMFSFQAANLINWMKNQHEINESLRQLPLEFDYRFETHQSPTYEIVYIWQNLCGLSIISVIVGIDCTVMVFIVHVSAQFKLVAARFQEIGRKIVAKEDQELRIEIGKCVTQHQHAIRVTKELAALLSPVIFCQIMSSGLEICLSGYALIYGEGSAVNILKFFILFMSLFSQLVIWCAPAELLIHESTAVADAIYYDVPWFELTPSLRRDLGFVVMRAQKGCHVTALYRVMSIGRITEVFNAAGSYLAMLRNLKQ